MLGVIAYQKSYIIDVTEVGNDDSPTWAWNAENPEASSRVEQAISTGELSEPGMYVLIGTEDRDIDIMRIGPARG
jgi:hypothetical protein